MTETAITSVLAADSFFGDFFLGEGVETFAVSCLFFDPLARPIFQII